MKTENTETYRTRMWITNDEGIYRAMCDLIGDHQSCDAEDILDDVANALQAKWEEMADEYTSGAPGPIAEMVDTFLASVDWAAIAEHYTDEAEKRAAENREDEEEEEDEDPTV